MCQKHALSKKYLQNQKNVSPDIRKKEGKAWQV